MTKSEKNEIIKWSNSVSNEELERTYYDTVYDTLGTQIDDMYELGYDMIDILEREKYEKYMRQKADLLEMLCEKRGIRLWVKQIRILMVIDMLNYVYNQCSVCGVVTDEWSYDLRTKKFMCLNCSEDLEDSKKIRKKNVYQRGTIII